MAAIPVPAGRAGCAAEGLYHRHGRRVHAFCLSRLRNVADAEDATQTTFMCAVKALDRGVTPRFESTWLLRIAENVCHSMRRRAYRRYEASAEEPELRGRGVDDRGDTHEQVAALRDALASLPENQRRAVILREWRGLSYDEIADELATSHAAVEMLLFRARRSLAARIATAPSLLPYLPVGRPLAWVLGSGGAKAAAAAAVVTTATAGVVHATQPAVARSAAEVAPTAVRVSTPVAAAATVDELRGHLPPQAEPVPARPSKDRRGQPPAGTDPVAAVGPEAVAPTSAGPAGPTVAGVDASAPAAESAPPTRVDVPVPVIPAVVEEVVPAVELPALPDVAVPALPEVAAPVLPPVEAPPALEPVLEPVVGPLLDP